MRRSILVLVGAITVAPLFAIAATASDEANVMATVNQYNEAFNKNDAMKAQAACAPQAIILDDFPPHVWQGATACSEWWNALDAYNTKNVITDGIVTLDKPWHVTVTGDRAYVVVPAKYTFKEKGKPVVESGSVWTFALQKLAGGWRITGWAWGQH